MATITDFDIWLEEADPEGHEEIYALYHCVLDEEDYGIWELKKRAGQLFIKAGHTDDVLRIASPRAKQFFLDIVKDRYVRDPGMDIEGWYGFRRAMEKDD
jgi:hypothetical protein